MITVGYLKKRLKNFNDTDRLYAYEGEVTGIIIISKGDEKNYTVIPATESDENEEEGEETKCRK